MIQIVPFKAASWPPDQIRRVREVFDEGLTDQWIIYQAMIMEEGLSWMAIEDEKPLAAAGIWEIYPGVAQLWVLMTELPREKTTAILRVICRMLPEICRLRRLRRLQAIVNPTENSAKLLNFFGLKREAVLPGYGIDGGGWHLYGRVI